MNKMFILDLICFLCLSLYWQNILWNCSMKISLHKKRIYTKSLKTISDKFGLSVSIYPPVVISNEKIRSLLRITKMDKFKLLNYILQKSINNNNNKNSIDNKSMNHIETYNILYNNVKEVLVWNKLHICIFYTKICLPVLLKHFLHKLFPEY